MWNEVSSLVYVAGVPLIRLNLYVLGKIRQSCPKTC